MSDAAAGDTPSVLARILDSTRAEIERRKRVLSESELEAMLASREHRPEPEPEPEPAPGPGPRLEPGPEPAPGTPAPVRERGAFAAALRREGMSVIAEFKRRSPSAGALREGASPDAIARAYERGGASALSVLTEEASFGGSLQDLRTARAACVLPILRKDFVVDRYQLLEARLAGADAVLLIVAALGDRQLAKLHDAARALDLDVLVEVHDARELQRALALEPQMIGINNRDLRDFSVDVARTRELRAAIPAGVAVVSESGIASAAQLRELHGDGVDAVLVGESLMRAEDPAAALRALLAREVQAVGDGTTTL